MSILLHNGKGCFGNSLVVSMVLLSCLSYLLFFAPGCRAVAGTASQADAPAGSILAIVAAAGRQFGWSGE